MGTSLMRLSEAVWATTERDIAERVLLILREEKYWIKHTFSQGQRRCLVGAADDAGVSTPYWIIEGFLDRCAEIIREQYPERYCRDPGTRPGTRTGYTIASFNDDDRTTYDDIRTVIEKVIAHG
jgi:hypothetical protein